MRKIVGMDETTIHNKEMKEIIKIIMNLYRIDVRSQEVDKKTVELVRKRYFAHLFERRTSLLSGA